MRRCPRGTLVLVSPPADDSTQTFLEISVSNESPPPRLNIRRCSVFWTLKAILGVIIVLPLMVLVLSPVSLVHATAYQPGVSVGQWAEYKPLYSTCSGDPTICASMSGGNALEGLDHGNLQIVLISGTSITLSLISAYTNGTTKSEGILVDVYSGDSNITGGTTPTNYLILAGGLHAGDHVSYPPISPTLNSTEARSVLGSTRTVNFLNYSSTFSYGGSGTTTSAGFAFDQQSGILIEGSFSVSSNSPYGSFDLAVAFGIVDTNIWNSQVSPDFAMSASPASVSVNQGSTGTSIISISRLNAFSSPVQLTVSFPQTGIACSLSSSSLTVGYDSSTLSCNGSAGTYIAIVTGDGGSGTHSVSVTFNVASVTAPSFTISSSGGVNFQTGSSGSSTITLTAQNGFSSTVDLQVIAPSGLTCSLSTTSLPGYGTSTLTCNGQPGSYTVTVKATSGSTTKTTPVQVQVSSLSTVSQPSNDNIMILIYAVVGAAAIVAVLAVYLVVKRRSSLTTPVPTVPNAPSSP